MKHKRIGGFSKSKKRIGNAKTRSTGTAPATTMMQTQGHVCFCFLSLGSGGGEVSHSRLSNPLSKRPTELGRFGNSAFAPQKRFCMSLASSPENANSLRARGSQSRQSRHETQGNTPVSGLSRRNLKRKCPAPSQSQPAIYRATGT
jgi:hypothetical protein